MENLDVYFVFTFSGMLGHLTHYLFFLRTNHVKIPKELPGLSKEICNPILSWNNKVQFVTTSYMLATMFQDNYKTKGFEISSFSAEGQ